MRVLTVTLACVLALLAPSVFVPSIPQAGFGHLLLMAAPGDSAGPQAL